MCFQKNAYYKTIYKKVDLQIVSKIFFSPRPNPFLCCKVSIFLNQLQLGRRRRLFCWCCKVSIFLNQLQQQWLLCFENSRCKVSIFLNQLQLRIKHFLKGFCCKVSIFLNQLQEKRFENEKIWGFEDSFSNFQINSSSN